jgi:hypothetical protein
MAVGPAAGWQCRAALLPAAWPHVKQATAQRLLIIKSTDIKLLRNGVANILAPGLLNIRPASREQCSSGGGSGSAGDKVQIAGNGYPTVGPTALAASSGASGASQKTPRCRMQCSVTPCNNTGTTT